MTETEQVSALAEFSTRYEDSLLVSAHCPFDAWARMGTELGLTSRATRWWVGDWLVQGEQLYAERYAQAMDATGLEYQTLMNLASVSRRVAPEVRRGGELSHAHHAEVAKFETPQEQSKWLQRAIEGKWTVKQLRQAIQESLVTVENAGTGTTPESGGSSEPDTIVAKAKVARIALEQLETWWGKTEKRPEAYAVLMTGTVEDRRPLFTDFAQLVAQALIDQGVRA